MTAMLFVEESWGFSVREDGMEPILALQKPQGKG